MAEAVAECLEGLQLEVMFEVMFEVEGLQLEVICLLYAYRAADSEKPTRRDTHS